MCLVEYHQGHFRRLRLVLTSQSLLTNGEKWLLDAQHPAHGKVHNSGLLFGNAARLHSGLPSSVDKTVGPSRTVLGSCRQVYPTGVHGIADDWVTDRSTLSCESGLNVQSGHSKGPLRKIRAVPCRFFCTGMGAMCAERHKSPSRIQKGGT